MKKVVFLFTFIFLLLSFEFCSAQWQQTSLDSLRIYCLDTNGTNIFAGTNKGMFLSTDKGGNWNAMNNRLTDQYISALALSGINIFVGTYYYGIFLSTNNGGNWDAVNTGLTNNYIQSLVMSQANIFALTLEGVFLSTNNGENWIVMNDTIGGSALAINGKNIFVGCEGHGVYLSTDNGIEWKAMKTGLPYSSVKSIVISGVNIFAGTLGEGVFLSTNNGTNWVNIGLTNLMVYSFAIKDSNIFAGTFGKGVFLSTNNGLSWIPINNGLPDNTIVYSFVISDGYIFAGTDEGVWKRSLKDILGVNELRNENGELSINVSPNPGNSLIVISYSLLEKSNVNIYVYDLLGNQVSSLVNKEQGKGDYKMELNVEKFTNGIYFCKVEAGNSSMTKKIVLMH